MVLMSVTPEERSLRLVLSPLTRGGNSWLLLASLRAHNKVDSASVRNPAKWIHLRLEE